MNSQRQVVLGLFMILTLSLLATYTLFLTKTSLFGVETVGVRFPAANGLRDGDAVLIAGMQLGKVRSLEYDIAGDPELPILVVLTLDMEITLYEDYVILIEASTILGGHRINISPGRSASPPLAAETILRGTVAPNPLESLSKVGEIIERNDARFDSIIANVDGLLADVRAGRGVVGRLVYDETLAAELASSVTSLDGTLDNARAITADLRAGEGTIGRLLREDVLYRRTVDIVEDLARVSADLRAGRGTLGRLLTDDELAAELDRGVRNLAAITDQVRSGEGTVGRLVYDDTLARGLEDLTAKLNGEGGTLGALIGERELYDNLLALSADLRAVTSAIKNGDGTLGRLVMEPDLYEDLLTSVRILNRGLEDYREAAPVSTLTSVLFGAF